MKGPKFSAVWTDIFSTGSDEFWENVAAEGGHDAPKTAEERKAAALSDVSILGLLAIENSHGTSAGKEARELFVDVSEFEDSDSVLRALAFEHPGLEPGRIEKMIPKAGGATDIHDVREAFLGRNIRYAIGFDASSSVGVDLFESEFLSKAVSTLWPRGEASVEGVRQCVQSSWVRDGAIRQIVWPEPLYLYRLIPDENSAECVDVSRGAPKEGEAEVFVFSEKRSEVPYPPFTPGVAVDDLVFLGGGGGASATGINNNIFVFRMRDDGTYSVVKVFDTGKFAVQHMTHDPQTRRVVCSMGKRLAAIDLESLDFDMGDAVNKEGVEWNYIRRIHRHPTGFVLVLTLEDDTHSIQTYKNFKDLVDQKPAKSYPFKSQELLYGVVQSPDTTKMLILGDDGAALILDDEVVPVENTKGARFGAFVDDSHFFLVRNQRKGRKFAPVAELYTVENGKAALSQQSGINTQAAVTAGSFDGEAIDLCWSDGSLMVLDKELRKRPTPKNTSKVRHSLPISACFPFSKWVLTAARDGTINVHSLSPSGAGALSRSRLLVYLSILALVIAVALYRNAP